MVHVLPMQKEMGSVMGFVYILKYITYIIYSMYAFIYLTTPTLVRTPEKNEVDAPHLFCVDLTGVDV